MPPWHEVIPAPDAGKREGMTMDQNDKILRYSIQVGYLGVLLQEKLLSEDEYRRCLNALKKDYGVVVDILVNE